MRPSRGLAFPVAAALLLIGACGVTPGAAGLTAARSAGPAPIKTTVASTAPVRTHEVTIANYSLDPPNVLVNVGATVTWTNRAAGDLTMTAGTPRHPWPHLFRLLLSGRDSSVSRTFDRPGTYLYFCDPHRFMTGSVTVEK